MKRNAFRMASIVGSFALFSSEALADGNWKTDQKGCKHWSSASLLDVTLTWTGQCSGGRASGTGVATTSKDGVMGGRYDGPMVDGKHDGRGVFTWANGNRYEGDWVAGRQTGKGLLTWADGSRYEGDWVAGTQTGKGVIAWANGNRYEGDYVADKQTGKGVFTWADGSRYEGDWVNDKRNGSGILSIAKGNEASIAKYRTHGKMEADRFVVRGEWKDDAVIRSFGSQTEYAEAQRQSDAALAVKVAERNAFLDRIAGRFDRDPKTHRVTFDGVYTTQQMSELQRACPEAVAGERGSYRYDTDNAVVTCPWLRLAQGDQNIVVNQSNGRVNLVDRTINVPPVALETADEESESRVAREIFERVMKRLGSDVVDIDRRLQDVQDTGADTVRIGISGSPGVVSIQMVVAGARHRALEASNAAYWKGKTARRQASLQADAARQQASERAEAARLRAYENSSEGRRAAANSAAASRASDERSRQCSTAKYTCEAPCQGMSNEKPGNWLFATSPRNSCMESCRSAFYSCMR